jgi:hypothetical protein
VRGVVSNNREAIKLTLRRQRSVVAVVETRSDPSDQTRRKLDRGCIGKVAMTGTEQQE